MKAKAELRISGDRYKPEGQALIEMEKRADGFFFAWKAVDSADSDIAQDSRTVSFKSMDNPLKPHPYLEQFISTHIQKSRLKRKNKMKVVKWEWLER